MKERSFLEAQIQELDRLLALAGNHPFMAGDLRQQKQELETRLGTLPAHHLSESTILYFTGGPVIGSWGIDAQFAANIVAPFSDMVKAQYSSIKHGEVRTRGPIRDKSEAKLMLTGLPRGSFGLELSCSEAPDLFGARRIDETLHQVTRLIKASAEDDENFSQVMSESPARLLSPLRKFLETAANGIAALRVVTGGIEIRLNERQVIEARDRVAGLDLKEVEEEIEGNFRGAMLDSWRFDFRRLDEQHIGGRIAEEKEDVDVVKMNQLTNRHCIASMRVTTVTTQSGVSRKIYTLLSLSPIEKS